MRADDTKSGVRAATALRGLILMSGGQISELESDTAACLCVCVWGGTFACLSVLRSAGDSQSRAEHLDWNGVDLWVQTLRASAVK